MMVPEHPLLVERQRQRLREVQRCLVIALNAETALVSAFMIDEALRLSAISRERSSPPVPVLPPEAVNAGASY